MRWLIAFFMLSAQSCSLCPADEPAHAKAVITDPNGQPLPEVMPLGEMVVFNFARSTYGGKPSAIRVLIEPEARASRAQFSADMLTAYVPTGLTPVEISCTLVVGKADTVDLSRIRVKCGEGPIPPPGPTPPVPPQPPTPTPPAPPTPQPVKAFRVIFVNDTKLTMPVGQLAARDAASVRTYLDSRVSKDAGGVPDWRAYSKDTPDIVNDVSGIKDLWWSAKPKITTTPCVIVEKDGVAHFESWPLSATASLLMLRKYGGE